MNLPDQILNKLRPWQRAPALHLLDILSRGQNALDISDTGTGKTYVACAVSAMLGVNTLAVVPKIARSAWLKVATDLGAPVEAIGYEALRTGQTNFGRWEHQREKAEEHFVCLSCQCVVDLDDYRPCHCHPAGLHCLKTKRKPHKYGKFIWSDQIKFLIGDEFHRFSGLDSLNADMLISAKRQGIRVLGLSATAACTPLQMRALGYVLGLHNDRHDILGAQTCVKGVGCRRDIFPSFGRWVSRYDVRPDPVYRGLKWFASTERQNIIMADIHKQIIPSRGVRVRTSDIPDFPARQIVAELYDLEKDYEIRKLYNEMASALEALSQRETQDANSELPLTKILRARQRIELLKVPIFVELAEDEMAKGNSVAMFLNFSATIDELAKRLQAHKPGVVDGSSEGVRHRGEAIGDFQKNETRLIILNSAAGGVAISLHDVCGGYSRAGLISPGTSAVQFRQICGRLSREGGKSPALYRVILAANTVETKMKKALDNKLTNLDSLNDSDLQPEIEI